MVSEMIAPVPWIQPVFLSPGAQLPKPFIGSQFFFPRDSSEKWYGDDADRGCRYTNAKRETRTTLLVGIVAEREATRRSPSITRYGECTRQRSTCYRIEADSRRGMRRACVKWSVTLDRRFRKPNTSQEHRLERDSRAITYPSRREMTRTIDIRRYSDSFSHTA